MIKLEPNTSFKIQPGNYFFIEICALYLERKECFINYCINMSLKCLNARKCVRHIMSYSMKCRVDMVMVWQNEESEY